MTVALDDLAFVGSGLNRPECVLATRAGALFVADWDGGVTRIGPDGIQQRYLAASAELRPNGIALRRDGSFLIAHLGRESGGVFHLTRGGEAWPLIEEVDGAALPATNFVAEDAQGRIWATVSTRLVPRERAFHAGNADGFILLQDRAGTRIVADGLGYTNEVALHPGGEWLYVNETFTRRLSRFRLAEDGSLSGRETVAEFGAGEFPDGLAFDAEGGVWIACIVGNRLIRVAPDGSRKVILEDSDPRHVAEVEAAYLGGTLARPHLDRASGRRLRNISSLAFGGADLRTVYLGCLLGDSLASFRAPVAGWPPPHWDVAG